VVGASFHLLSAVKSDLNRFALCFPPPFYPKNYCVKDFASVPRGAVGPSMTQKVFWMAADKAAKAETVKSNNTSKRR